MIIIFDAFIFVGKKIVKLQGIFPVFFYSFFAFLLLRVVTPLV